jgi:arylsulfatase A-like enzyme
MPFAKGTLYDPGVKIPLVIRYPRIIEGGSRCNALGSNVDLLPTLLELIGKTEHIPQGIDGNSLWSAIENSTDVSSGHIFCEQTWHDFYEPIRSIRTSRHKLIRNLYPGVGLQVAADILQSATTSSMRETIRKHPRPAYELYDLAADPSERRNICGKKEFEEIENQLKTLLMDHLVKIKDPVLDGVVPAPHGYIEYYMASATGPGGLPPAAGEEEWHTWRWPIGAVGNQKDLHS